MDIKRRQEQDCAISRKNRKMRKNFKRMLFLLASCFLLFILGQEFTNIVLACSISENKLPVSVSKSQVTNGNDRNNIIIKNSSLHNKNDWNLILVNTWNKLPVDFNIEVTKLKNGQSVDKRIYPELQAMLDDARAEGLSPVICSSFRTMEKQQSLFDNQVNKYISRGYSIEQAKIESGKWVAIPGTSEHQAGLAVDIVALSNQVLNKEQEKSAEQKWLMKNCYKYGFILRYPSDKSEITGIGYEPWHYRYVGKDVAKEIMDNGICLEEYLQSLK
nr:M15 family metallopeptidase [uncultured Aminipila sp.]